jgi:uncharacterized protein YndB with AHSA1/START domain
MVEIEVNKLISAPLDRVWSIVLDVDREPRYWQDLHSVYDISRNGNIIEREVTVGFRILKGS